MAGGRPAAGRLQTGGLWQGDITHDRAQAAGLCVETDQTKGAGLSAKGWFDERKCQGCCAK